MAKWGSPVEIQTAIRMRLAAAAYAYEIDNDPIISDAEFDYACTLIDLRIDTTRPDLDDYFREHFDPSTGMWIYKHPELSKVEEYLWRLRNPAEYRAQMEADLARLKARIDDHLSNNHSSEQVSGDWQGSGDCDGPVSPVHPLGADDP